MPLSGKNRERKTRRVRTKRDRPVSLSAALMDSETSDFVYISKEIKTECLMNVPYLFN